MSLLAEGLALAVIAAAVIAVASEAWRDLGWPQLPPPWNGEATTRVADVLTLAGVLVLVGLIVTGMALTVASTGVELRSQEMLDQEIEALKAAASTGELPPLPPTKELQALIDAVTALDVEIAHIGKDRTDHIDQSQHRSDQVLQSFREDLIEEYVEKDLQRRIAALVASHITGAGFPRQVGRVENILAFFFRRELLGALRAVPAFLLAGAGYVFIGLTAILIADQSRTGQLTQMTNIALQRLQVARNEILPEHSYEPLRNEPAKVTIQAMDGVRARPASKAEQTSQEARNSTAESDRQDNTVRNLATESERLDSERQRLAAKSEEIENARRQLRARTEQLRDRELNLATKALESQRKAEEDRRIADETERKVREREHNLALEAERLATRADQLLAGAKELQLENDRRTAQTEKLTTVDEAQRPTELGASQHAESHNPTRSDQEPTRKERMIAVTVEPDRDEHRVEQSVANALQDNDSNPDEARKMRAVAEKRCERLEATTVLREGIEPDGRSAPGGPHNSNRGAAGQSLWERRLVDCGHTLMFSGDVAGARTLFVRATDIGFYEGALSLGTTYDPAALAKAGLPSAFSDPDLARHWYRQALALKRK
jgi:hypothetical protein